MEEPMLLTREIKSEKKFVYEENNKKYDIIFKLNNSLIDIYLKDNNSFPQSNYSQSFSYEKIIEKCKIFKIYDNLTQIYVNIITLMEKKKYLIEIKNSSLFLTFNLDLGNFGFELSAKKNNIDDTVNYLADKVKYLIDENNEIKNKLSQYCKENNELKNKIITLENEVNYFKEKEKQDELFKGSTIIQSIEE